MFRLQGRRPLNIRAMELIPKLSVIALDWIIQNGFMLIIGKYLREITWYSLYETVWNSKGLEMMANQISSIPIFLWVKWHFICFFSM